MTEVTNTPASDRPQSITCIEEIPSNLIQQSGNDEAKHEGNARDRDSGVFLSDDEGLPLPSRKDSVSLNRATSVKSMVPKRTDSSIRRLARPAELNLGANAAADPSKRKSELEMRYDLIRNSQTQSKAALLSPTKLLSKRLNMSPKLNPEEKVRIFTPPKPMLNGCILPGPSAQMGAFTGSDVRAKTEKGRPAWWCKFDKLVVFDGAEETEGGELRFKTRSSKGLSVARRRGDTETVIIPMECAHCQEMLNRHEWKYDMQVCKRTVCWDCKERCRWEMDEEKKMKEVQNKEAGNVSEKNKDANRDRADSVLQDDQGREEQLMEKVGIEHGPRIPIEIVGGIEERLGG